MTAQSFGKEVLLVFDNDIGSALSMACTYDQDMDALHLAKAAQIVRREMFNTCNRFDDLFAQGCQESSVPLSLKALVQMILEGASIESQSQSQQCVPAALSISQLLLFNALKHPRRPSEISKTRHNLTCETPLPLYLSMKLHAETRKRELVDDFFSLGLCVSYDRLLQVSAALGNRANLCYGLNSGLNPPSLHAGLFTTSAVDNIDHSPSSTSAQSAFHGTAISLTQHPGIESDGLANQFQAVLCDDGCKSLKPLPQSYTTVPLTKPVNKSVQVPVINSLLSKLSDLNATTASPSLQVEYQWLEAVNKTVEQPNVEVTNDTNLSWAAFHASVQPQKTVHVSQSTLLPLFREAANSVAMICHSMNIVANATYCANPGQTPVLTVDQPLFALAKQIQWNWPENFGEHRFVLVLGGLHLEMAALRTLGNWLHCSGWTTAIVNTNVTSCGKADTLLHASRHSY